MLSGKLRTLSLAAVAAASVGFCMSASAEVSQINGAGSTFVYPILAKWADAYRDKTGIKLNYQSIGSGGGIKQIKAKTVDFGASDAPLKKKELEANGLMQFPVIIGGVVPVVHIEGVKAGELRLDSKVFSDIYLGKITNWNDPEIAKLNPDVKLPDAKITVVHRSDGSGTTWIFTSYLTKVSSTWAKKVGHEKAVAWPVGVGGKGNEGVASYVNRINNSIGYVEYAYALQNDMAYVLLKNKDGKYVAPTAANFQNAAGNADWENAPGFYEVLTDQPGGDSWPITGATFVLMHTNQAKPDVATAALKFFDWAYVAGDDMADKLHYVSMPDNVVKLVETAWHKQVKTNDKALWPSK